MCLRSEESVYEVYYLIKGRGLPDVAPAAATTFSLGVDGSSIASDAYYITFLIIVTFIEPGWICIAS